jgi:hypothetical protein
MSALSDAKTALKAPATGLTWLQLAAATVFVIVVAFMWRQVTHFIMGEI